MRAALLALLAAACLALAAVPRGVAPSVKALYSGIQFTCRDGSQKLPLTRVNDDFCDCADGSDEPGTSACSNGAFWCKNKGFRGASIPSWKVNDRICDCCDGADEFDGASRCPNTCAEMDREAKKGMYAELERLKSGLAKKKQYIAASEALRTAASSLADLKLEVEHKREEVKLQEDLKLQAEERERTALAAKTSKEQEERAAYEALHPTPVPPAPVEGAPVEYEYELPADGSTSTHVEDHGEMPYDVVHDDDGGMHDEHYDEEVVHAAPVAPQPPALEVPEASPPPQPPIPEAAAVVAPATPPPPPFEPSEELKELQEESAKFQEESYSSHLPPPHIKSQLDEHLRDARGRQPLYQRLRAALLGPIDALLSQLSEMSLFIYRFLFASPDDLDASAAEAEARRQRDAYTEASSRLRELEGKLSTAEKLLSADLGPQREYYPLWEQTFASQIEQYKYELKPFNEVLQGHTSMGKWAGWVAGHAKMSYTNGASCWQGPARSCEVTLLCGDKEEILEVREPNKCEYVMKFTTPAACNDHDLDRLQRQLQSTDQE